MKLLDALKAHPNAKIFKRVGGHKGDATEEEFEPLDAEILSELEPNEDWLYIVKAKHISPNGTINDCYLDITLPERINDCAYFVHGGKLEIQPWLKVEGDLVAAVPIDCPGDYHLFYSKLRPSLGIETLREGLRVAGRKKHIAEDLAYILREEGRYQEAVEAFLIVVREGTRSSSIYKDLADCCEKLGDSHNAERYHGIYDEYEKEDESKFE